MATIWTYLLTAKRFEIYSNGECVCFMSARVGYTPRESAQFYLRELFKFMSGMLNTELTTEDMVSLSALSSNAILKLINQIQMEKVSL